MRRILGWLLGSVLALAGLVLLVQAPSLLMPATNPISPAATSFQQTTVTITAAALGCLGASSFLFSRLVERPSLSRTLWRIAGGILLVLGLMLLNGAVQSAVDAPPEPSPAHRQRRLFVGALAVGYLSTGAFALWATWAQAKRKPKER
jgi:threonine/homoserine/homoserine lactone efflux protein